MKYALIGCGRISPNHIEAAKNNGLEIVALCDIDIDNAKAKAESAHLSPDVKIYSDYNKMLDETSPELVAIATESGKQAFIAIDALNAGCNLIIEKPIALSLADADEIIKLSDEKNLKVCACHQNRFNKSIQKIRQALEMGRFGTIMNGSANIRWQRNRQYYEQAKWRGTYEQDGGALMNQCIHNIDLLRWMLGDDVDEVFAYTENFTHPYIEAEDFGAALVRFSNGAIGTIEGSTNVFPKNLEETLYIFGEKGTVKASGHSVNIIEEWAFADNIDNPEEVKNLYRENPPNVYGFGHTPLYKDVIAAIRENRAPYVDARAGRRALELVLSIYKSAKERKPVKLPLKNCSTMDFKK